MESSTITLTVLVLGLLLFVWLVFAMFRKLFGLAVLAALIFGAYMIWSNPALLTDITSALNI